MRKERDGLVTLTIGHRVIERREKSETKEQKELTDNEKNMDARAEGTD